MRCCPHRLGYNLPHFLILVKKLSITQILHHSYDLVYPLFLPDHSVLIDRRVAGDTFKKPEHTSSFPLVRDQSGAAAFLKAGHKPQFHHAPQRNIRLHKACVPGFAVKPKITQTVKNRDALVILHPLKAVGMVPDD